MGGIVRALLAFCLDLDTVDVEELSVKYRRDDSSRCPVEDKAPSIRLYHHPRKAVAPSGFNQCKDGLAPAGAPSQSQLNAVDVQVGAFLDIDS
uniref:Uncharacterized protein n=1 Tax=Plectus sambesii TaxID=2011161 RepID=A0A914WSA7_9BILA